MASYPAFTASLLPGNYALTKSMEQTRVQSSGTLWYTKKFLVLYYYVFLSNEIGTREYIPRVIRAFDDYIAALDPAVREEAERFFYPPESSINFKSEHFTVFSSFAGQTDFPTQKEKLKYDQSARKLYFTLLMDAGGQKGVKKRLKEALHQEGFVYTKQTVAAILREAAIAVTVEECNLQGRVTDHSMPHLLSPEAIAQAQERVRAGETLDFETVAELARRFPMEHPNYDAVERDLPSFMRNERKALYYYGFFHSRSYGANDFEFSSLTPLGELALSANADEFLALWEHQKLKMISQPPTAEINNVFPAQNPPERFSISYSPYRNILRHLCSHGELSLEQYQYILSRLNHSLDGQEPEEEVFARLDEIKSLVAGFGRRGDVAVEDNRKELMKYLLGVRADLPFDRGTNPLGFCAVTGGQVLCLDRERCRALCRVYDRLNEYKLARFGPLFERCEADLRRRYIASCAGTPVPIDGRVKIEWDLYNIHPDKFILLGVMIAIADCAGVRNTAENANAVADCIGARFPSLLRHLGLRGAAAVRREIGQALAALNTGDYGAYLAVPEARAEGVTARYRAEGAAALWRKIEALSREATVEYAADRVRNTRLVSLLKSYYMERFLENGTLKCECCGQELFLTEAGEPYTEFHHLIPFGMVYGPDHYLNLFALCPNCHRKLHVLPAENKRIAYGALSRNNYLRLALTERLRTLKEERLLRSYHLEYLLVDKAITQEEYNAVAA
ncbi:MAG: HNH endonuclease [Oscillospiraceae bacterium]